MKAFNTSLFLIICVTTLQAMDILLTYYGLQLGLTEWNSLYGETVSVLKIILPSMVYLLYVFLSKYLNYSEQQKMLLVFNVAWLFVVIFYIVVTIHNVYLITLIHNAAT